MSPQDLDESKAAETEDTTENDVSDPEEEEDDELTDSQQTNQLSELYCTTLPSVDSAMESWDGSAMDAAFSAQGSTSTSITITTITSTAAITELTLLLVIFSLLNPAGNYSHQAAGVALHPNEWRSVKQPCSTTPPTSRRKNYPFSDGGFSEDDWDHPPGYRKLILILTWFHCSPLVFLIVTH